MSPGVIHLLFGLSCPIRGPQPVPDYLLTGELAKYLSQLSTYPQALQQEGRKEKKKTQNKSKGRAR